MSKSYYFTATVDNEYVRVSFDATTDIRTELNATLTEFITQEGTQGSDHYFRMPTKIALNGTISDIKAIGSGFSTEEEEIVVGEETLTSLKTADTKTNSDKSTTYSSTEKNIGIIKRIRDLGVPCVVYADSQSYSECYMTNILLQQNKTRGVVTNTNGNISSYDVVINFKKILKGSRAKIVSEVTEISFDQILPSTPDNSSKTDTEGQKDEGTKEEVSFWDQLIQSQLNESPTSNIF